MEQQLGLHQALRHVAVHQQKVYAENEEKYKTIASAPSWARAAIQQVYEELGLAGTGGTGANTRIDASETYVRALAVIAKVLDKLNQEQGSA